MFCQVRMIYFCMKVSDNAPGLGQIFVVSKNSDVLIRILSLYLFTIDGATTSLYLWWSGYKKDRRAGVGIAIRMSKTVQFENVNYVSPRLMWIDLLCYGMEVRVVSAYSPTELGTVNQNNDFYRLLNNKCKPEDKR